MDSYAAPHFIFARARGLPIDFETCDLQSFDILPTRQDLVLTTMKGKLQGRNSDGRR